MTGIDKLIDGYKNFYQQYFVDNDEVYKKLATGQSPIATMIACSDSRVDPAMITGAEPGELFVIRNVANLIPPYQDDHTTYHGTSAALEFAINSLNIPNIIVFGHSKCAGIKALMDGNPSHDADHSFVEAWMKIAKDVKKDIKENHSNLTQEKQTHLCERKAIELSLVNLLTFPWIVEKEAKGELTLHGWYFDIEQGMLFHFDRTTQTWKAAQ